MAGLGSPAISSRKVVEGQASLANRLAPAGATAGATGVNDLDASRTSPDSRSDARPACGRIRTTSEIVWVPTDQKVEGSNPSGGAQLKGPFRSWNGPFGDNGDDNARLRLLIPVAQDAVGVLPRGCHSPSPFQIPGPPPNPGRSNAEAKKRRLIRELQALGCDVTIQPAA